MKNHYLQKKTNCLLANLKSTGKKAILRFRTPAAITSVWVILAGVSVFAEDINSSLFHNGKTRTYLLHLPAGYDGSQPLPLVFAFHGLTSTGSSMADITGFSPLADAENFIVAYPDGLNKRWAAPDGNTDDIGFISELINHIVSNYNIDTNRIYACGASNGGMFTYRLALELTDVFAAAGIVAGYIPSYSPLPSPAPDRPISIVHFHGTSDGMIPYDKAEDAADFWVDFNGCNPTPEIQPLPDVDPNDGTTVDYIHYSGGTDGTSMSIYKVYNGGHTWPGATGGGMPGKVTRDIDATQILWDFFKGRSLATANVPPSVEITKPSNGATYTAPATFRIKANATDSDGSISKVDFYHGTMLLKSDSTESYGYLWENAAAGIYTIYVVATDNAGGTSADTTTITINSQRLSGGTTDGQPGVIFDQQGQQLLVEANHDGTGCDLFVYDLRGILVLHKENMPAGQHVISVQSLTGGVYVYSLKSAGKNALCGKFITVD